jgi:signal transduction histidine kinase/PAS domain-containing protein
LDRTTPPFALPPDLPAEEVLRVLDANGIQLAVVGADGVVQWASPSLVRSRGAQVVGGESRKVLLRREKDHLACRHEEVLESGRPNRRWIPETRPGSLGPRQLLIQLRLPAGQVLDAIIDAGPADRGFPDQVFRERVLSEGLRHVPAGVLLLDASMKAVAANPAAAEMLRRTEADLKGKALEDLLPEGSLPARGPLLAALLAESAALEEREIVLGRGPSRRVAQFYLAAVSGPNQELAAAVAILSDISSERILNEALSRKVGELTLLREIGLVLGRTARLDQVLRVILAAVVHPGGLGLGAAALFLAEEGKNTIRGRLARQRPPALGLASRDELGQELEAMAFGPSSSADRELETVVKRFGVALDRNDHPLAAAIGRPQPTLFEAGGPADDRDPRLVTLFGHAPVLLAPLYNQGRRLGVLVGVALPGDPPLDEDRIALGGLIAGTAAGAIARSRLHDELAGRLEDLRDANARLRNLQGQLLKAERLSAIGELAAEIVHQIRNPLSVVGGFSRRLARTITDDDPRRHDVRILLEETARMETILERIRQDVRLARSPARESVDPDELVRDAVARYRDLARELRVALVGASDPGLPQVRGNREILLEVLDNLLRNAFDAIGEAGRVTVSARRFRDAVHLVVEDDGPGIAPEHLDRIFEPFYTTKVGGTGLGLPLSKRLVAQCGGSLFADSRPGEGSRFRIVLPAFATPAPEADAAAVERPAATLPRTEEEPGHVADPDR